LRHRLAQSNAQCISCPDRAAGRWQDSRRFCQHVEAPFVSHGVPKGTSLYLKQDFVSSLLGAPYRITATGSGADATRELSASQAKILKISVRLRQGNVAMALCRRVVGNLCDILRKPRHSETAGSAKFIADVSPLRSRARMWSRTSPGYWRRPWRCSWRRCGCDCSSRCRCCRRSRCWRWRWCRNVSGGLD
jgi:hypothetical protein